jgi:chromate reductase
MSVPTIAVFVGSLRKDSATASWPMRWRRSPVIAHASSTCRSATCRYDQDFDGQYPPQGTRLKDQVRRRRGAVRDP